MEAKIRLLKKEGTYFSQKDKKDKPYTNFYIECNDTLIPVEIKYFPRPEFNDRDPGYSARFAVLSAFAEFMPEKEENDNKAVAASETVPSTEVNEKTQAF